METAIIYKRKALGDAVYEIAKKADGAVFARIVPMGGYGKPHPWGQVHKMPDLSTFTRTDRTVKRFPKSSNLL